jgi:hypothetical protein
MEPFSHHYSHRPRVDEPVDSTLKVMLDEFEHCAEERLVSLEMAHMELEVGRTDLEKRINDLALEVTRVNHFFEREHVFNQ